MGLKWACVSEHDSTVLLNVTSGKPVAAGLQSILTWLTDGNRRVPIAVSFTVDHTAAPEDVTFLTANHKIVLVTVEESKSGEKDALWNMWPMTCDF